MTCGLSLAVGSAVRRGGRVSSRRHPHGSVRDLNALAVEAAEHESVEAFVVGPARFSKQIDRDRFAELQPLDAVRAEVHARGVAAARDVCRELVELATERQTTLAAPRLECRAVESRLHWLRYDHPFIEECLQHRCAGAGVDGM